MRYPKEIEVWEHAPGRRLVEVVVKIRNEKGALAKCSQVLNDSSVNILTGFFTAPSSSTGAFLSFFADVTDSEGGLTELKKTLQGLDVIESVDGVAAEGGFMVDRQHFPVQWAGRKAVVMRTEALNEMLNRLWAVFGTGAATIIDQMAEAMGRHSAREVVEDFGKRFAVDQIDELIATYSALGYADVSIEKSKSSDFPIVVNARELFECEANAKLKFRRRSGFFRAHLRGFMSGIFGKPLEVSEVQCLTEGDEVCSFRVALSEAAVPSVTSRLAERGARA
ncbi:MAG: hypothetical protein JRN50_04335 [Nitrososphaerota archaeon]|nr:hypothetical protein [Nitrososphaerota archaeon]